MSNRALSLSVLLLALTLATSAQHLGNSGSLLNNVSGTVRTMDGHGVADVRVEIRNMTTGQSVASGYTNPAGAFEFHGVPNGSFEVIATSGLNMASDRIQVQGVDSTVTLEMPTGGGDPKAGDASTVSVAQLK